MLEKKKKDLRKGRRMIKKSHGKGEAGEARETGGERQNKG